MKQHWAMRIGMASGITGALLIVAFLLGADLSVEWPALLCLFLAIGMLVDVPERLRTPVARYLRRQDDDLHR